jgi:hypothetical protein
LRKSEVQKQAPNINTGVSRKSAPSIAAWLKPTVSAASAVALPLHHRRTRADECACQHLNAFEDSRSFKTAVAKKKREYLWVGYLIFSALWDLVYYVLPLHVEWVDAASSLWRFIGLRNILMIVMSLRYVFFARHGTDYFGYGLA